MTLFIKLIVIGNSCLLLLTLGALLAPFFSPISSRILSVLGLLFPYLVLFHLLFILFWLFIGKSKFAFGSIIILLIGFNSILNIFGCNIIFQENEDTPLLTIATYNVQFHVRVSLKEPPNAITPNSYQSFLMSQKEIDILCIQELDSLGNDFLLNFSAYPYHLFLPNEKLGLYSRYPIIEKGLVPFKASSSGNCLWASILYNKQIIRVYNFHLASNRPWELNTTFEEIVNRYTKDKTEYFKILSHYPFNSYQRMRQAEQIRQHQRKTPYPTILCGDLNDIPNSRVFSVISEGLSDSFREKGFGNGRTFNSWNKILRLDYILVNQNIEIKSHQIVKSNFSDHYLIKSNLRLTNQPLK